MVTEYGMNIEKGNTMFYVTMTKKAWVVVFCASITAMSPTWCMIEKQIEDPKCDFCQKQFEKDQQKCTVQDDKCFNVFHIECMRQWAKNKKKQEIEKIKQDNEHYKKQIEKMVQENQQMRRYIEKINTAYAMIKNRIGKEAKRCEEHKAPQYHQGGIF
jgi:hypothetical protein